MPIFEYLCLGCGKKFELLQKSANAVQPKCPGCGSTEVEKELSTFSSGTGSSQGSCAPSGG